MSNQDTVEFHDISPSMLPSNCSENYILSYNALFSLPIRMPGITVSVYSTTPTFQLTLKGGCDESSIFEMNQMNYIWKITPMNFALGRLVYDIVWEEDGDMDILKEKFKPDFENYSDPNQKKEKYDNFWKKIEEEAKDIAKNKARDTWCGDLCCKWHARG